MTRRPASPWLVAVALVVASCGGTPGRASIDAVLQAKLRQDTEQLAIAAAAHNAAQTRIAATTLSRDADAGHAMGGLSDSKLQAIRASLAAIQSAATAWTLPRTSAPAVTKPVPAKPAPAPKPPGKGKHDGGGNSADGGDGG